MLKKTLVQMKPLYVTPEMINLVKLDIPQREKDQTGKECDLFKRRTYMRSSVEKGILQVAFFFAKYMRLGADRPAFVVYLSKKKRQFITYDHLCGKWREATLCRLYDYWKYLYYDRRIWIDEADEKMIQEYLGSDQNAYDAITQFQLEIREEQLKARHKKETDSWDKDMALVPSVPKDWKRWVDKVAIPQNYIFYRYIRGGAKKGYCTYCGKEVPITEKPRNNRQGKCSCCHRQITFKAIGKAGNFSTEAHFAYLIQKCKEGFVIREWSVRRSYQKDEYETPRLQIFEARRVLYDSKLNPRAYMWGIYKQKECRWIATSICNPKYSGYYYESRLGDQGFVYGRTLPNLRKNELKQTGLAEWIQKEKYVDPEKYMAILQEFPRIEQIWKSNLPAMMKECMLDYEKVKQCIADPDAGDIAKAFGIDTQRFNRLRKYNGTTALLQWLQYEKHIGKTIDDQVFLWFCSQKVRHKDIRFIEDRMSIIQIYNYLRRQTQSFRDDAQTVLTTWKDYLSMAERLHMDISNEIIYKTKDLRRHHNELVRFCTKNKLKLQIEKFEEDYPLVNSVCQKIKEKYEYMGKDYMIVVPNGVSDIVLEGRALHHCAAGSERYWDRIERKESFIVFLRKVKSPDIPYYTLEIEPDGTIRQKRTEYDRQNPDIEEATQFLMEWQKAVAKRLDTEDRKLTAVSRTLRKQELEQLRRDKVMINTRYIQGKLLVDVLLDDLLENTATSQEGNIQEAA